MGKSRGNHGKIFVYKWRFSWENHGKISVNGGFHGKIMGKTWENLCKWKFSWENHGETTGKSL